MGLQTIIALNYAAIMKEKDEECLTQFTNVYVYLINVISTLNPASFQK